MLEQVPVGVAGMLEARQEAERDLDRAQCGRWRAQSLSCCGQAGKGCKIYGPAGTSDPQSRKDPQTSRQGPVMTVSISADPVWEVCEGRSAVLA